MLLDMNMIIKKLLKARLKKSFFTKETTLVAQNLLGKLLVMRHNNNLLIGKIVETESYRSDDPASHAFIGKTERNCAMFGPVGHAYVYLSHGLHYGFNIVARSKDYPAGGVLIRAVEPLEGIEIMAKHRKLQTKMHLAKNLTNGPGKLTQAFGINKKYNHHNLVTSTELFVAENILHTVTLQEITQSPRIGISKAQSHLWRFFIKDNPFVSPFKHSKS
jgi:DNA-3-methyladenine glycosylase